VWFAHFSPRPSLASIEAPIRLTGALELELELELIQPHMAQKPVLRGALADVAPSTKVSTALSATSSSSSSSSATMPPVEVKAALSRLAAKAVKAIKKTKRRGDADGRGRSGRPLFL